jgi:uncharacterized membrane protein YbhN (UPF0104 family)
MKRFRWLLRLLGLVLFVVILKSIDVSRIVSILAQANLWLVGLSIILVIPHLISKAWRWQVLLRGVDISIGLKESTLLYAIGQAAGFLTPGQAGDAVKAVYLKAEGYSLARSLVATVVDRMYDLAVVGGLALWGVFVFGDVPAGQQATIVAFVLGIIALFILFSSHGWQAPLSRLMVRLVPQRYLRGRDPRASLEGLALPPPALLTSAVGFSSLRSASTCPCRTSSARHRSLASPPSCRSPLAVWARATRPSSSCWGCSATSRRSALLLPASSCCTR